MIVKIGELCKVMHEITAFLDETVSKLALFVCADISRATSTSNDEVMYYKS